MRLEPTDVPPPGAPTPGVPPRFEWLREERLRATRNESIIAVLASAASIGIWIFAGGARVRSPTFLLLGLALLWAWSKVRQWRTLQRNQPAAETAPERAALAAVQRESVARHRSLLSARPPRLTYALLACILCVAALQVISQPPSIALAGLVKPAVRSGEWWRLLTASYMHVGLWHLWMNATVLLSLGAIVEAYGSRLRLPLVYLAAAIAGSVASLYLLPRTTSVGASGGILGLAAFLSVQRWRRPSEIPSWLGTAMFSTLALTAYIGFFGIGFIDNAAHAGGALAGALIGVLVIPREPAVMSERESRVFDGLGYAACVVLILGMMTAGAALRERRFGPEIPPAYLTTFSVGPRDSYLVTGSLEGRIYDRGGRLEATVTSGWIRSKKDLAGVRLAAVLAGPTADSGWEKIATSGSRPLGATLAGATRGLADTLVFVMPIAPNLDRSTHWLAFEFQLDSAHTTYICATKALDGSSLRLTC